MEPAIVFHDSFEVSLKTGSDMADITDALNRKVDAYKIQNGVLSAMAVGSTASLTAIEYESGVIEDLKMAIHRLAPPNQFYAHEEAWHDGNGHSHVQAALLGPSISIPIRQGRLKLGTWQQVVVINHDNKPRKREIEITIVGTI